MNVLNIGSMNLDTVYQVPHFVQPGETLHALGVSVHCGGKGLNQSIALARAGAPVYHAGCIGPGGEMLVDALNGSGVDTRFIRKIDAPQGSALIQVNPEGENCIIVYGGSNQAITPQLLEEVLSQFVPGDYLVLQNEVNDPERIIETAYAKGLKIVLNPSPVDERILQVDFRKITWLLINEVEAQQICGQQEPELVWNALHEKYPALNLLMTRGSRGAVCFTGEEAVRQDAFRVQAVDTTAAGDTFTGYFVAGIMEGITISECLKRAACASAIAVTRPGAGDSVPTVAEVEQTLKEWDK